MSSVAGSAAARTRARPSVSFSRARSQRVLAEDAVHGNDRPASPKRQDRGGDRSGRWGDGADLKWQSSERTGREVKADTTTCPTVDLIDSYRGAHPGMDAALELVQPRR